MKVILMLKQKPSTQKVFNNATAVYVRQYVDNKEPHWIVETHNNGCFDAAAYKCSKWSLDVTT